MRACIIGLDCLEPTLVDRWLGDLPTFAKLRKMGVWGRMRSCVPPITVPAWSCMTSSHDPGSLGIYGFRNRTDYTYTGLGFATADWVKVDRLWDILSRDGRTCSVLGVPGTFPVRPVNGQMVSCFLTPNERAAWTFPTNLKDEIFGWLGGNKYLFDVADFRSADKARILDDIGVMTARRFTVAREMLSRYKPDFFMMVEMGSDRIHHGFWHYMDAEHHKHERGPLSEAIHDYYVQLDNEIARLLEQIDLRESSLLIVSDHGAKRLDGGICLNEWLIREGWLFLKDANVLPGTPLSKCDVDWSRTRAWSEGGYYARVCLNVRGREPQGIVAPEDFEKTRDELAARIKLIPDDHGRTLNTAALKPGEIYRRVEGIAPDLVVIFGDLHWRAVGTLGHPSLYLFENDTGPDEANHAQYGFFNWIAPGVVAKTNPVDIDILDIAPTLLSHLGHAVPTGMQGNVIQL